MNKKFVHLIHQKIIFNYSCIGTGSPLKYSLSLIESDSSFPSIIQIAYAVHVNILTRKTCMYIKCSINCLIR